MRTIWLAFFFSSTLAFTDCSRGHAENGVGQRADLNAYTHCEFSDGLQVVEVNPLARGVTARTVDTASGPKLIKMLSGFRIMFAYPNTDFFANVKAERLPSSEYPRLKQALIENFDYILASASSNRRNESIGPTMNGLEVYGLDRDRLEGGVIGLYLLFNDEKHVATTIYLLNQESSRRKFQTVDQYRSVRDRFLLTYGACIQKASK